MLTQTLSTFSRIGGRRIYPLPQIATLQTDGSFRPGRSAVAFILRNSAGNQLLATTQPLYDARSSTEAEWASVAFGLHAAIRANEECIGIENDCLGVIAALTFPQTQLRHAYARHYRSKILKDAAETIWTGLRWIPRRENRADDLFR